MSESEALRWCEAKAAKDGYVMLVHTGAAWHATYSGENLRQTARGGRLVDAVFALRRQMEPNWMATA